jgi:hypothetical protein
VLRQPKVREQGLARIDAPRTGRPSLNKLELKVQALKLRRQGYEYSEIAKRLNISRHKANSLVLEIINDYCETCPEDAVIVRELELSRLDIMLNSIMPMFADGQPVPPQYIAAVLAIQERRSKYLGLDAEQKVKVQGEIGIREIVGVDTDKI